MKIEEHLPRKLTVIFHVNVVDSPTFVERNEALRQHCTVCTLVTKLSCIIVGAQISRVYCGR
jgi:hypothetical protein